MAGELQISEYVPRTVIRVKRLCKILLLGCAAAIVILFYRGLSEVAELREQCNQYEDAAIRYGKLVEEGNAACEAGDFRLGERLFLTAMQIRQTDPEIYLRLSLIYQEYRFYDLAAQILAEYPGEDAEIATAQETLAKEIGVLEVSVLKEME